MDDGFDPVPRVSPFFKGLTFAVMLVALGLAVWGMLILAVAVMVGWQP
jgi:hypothetical protein